MFDVGRLCWSTSSACNETEIVAAVLPMRVVRKPTVFDQLRFMKDMLPSQHCRVTQQRVGPRARR